VSSRATIRQYCFGCIVVRLRAVFLDPLGEDAGHDIADLEREAGRHSRGVVLHSLAAENGDRNFLEFLRVWG
jgi:hypothetical protein